MVNNPIRIGGVETFSTVDFPNKISAVIFMQGCPWRCPFCHNAFLQEIGADNGFVWENFINFLQRRRKVLDGVVFSGGEPLVQEGLAAAIEEVKNLGLEIGLHTGGYRPEHLNKILPLLDWVGLDIKAPLDEAAYTRAIGVPAALQLPRIRKSLELLLGSGIDFECRTTCDPRILSEEDVRKIAEQLASQGVKKYFLQKYRPVAEDKNTSDADCEKFFVNRDLMRFVGSKFAVFEVRR